MVFASKNSDWVKLDQMKCPWALDESPRCGFVRWYSILSSNGHIWSASQVLVLLLDTLPSFKPLDGSVLFNKHCFGEIPSEQALCEFRELDQLIACSVSFSRAQALLDLTLILYPNNDKWREIFEVALGYHQAAKFLTTIISRNDMRSLPHFKCYVQGIQFERVRETLINQGPGTISPSPAFDYSRQSSGHQDPRGYIICHFQFLFDSPGYFLDYQGSLNNLASLLDFQLRDHGNLIGFIQALDLCITLIRTFIIGHRAQSTTTGLSSAADSFLPVSYPMKQTARIEWLMQVLQRRLQSIIPANSAFGESADLGLFTSGSLDIPTYIWAVQTIQKTLAQTPLGWWRNPLASDPYTEGIRKILLEPFSMKSLNDLAELAGLVLERRRRSVGAGGHATEMQQMDTGQTSELSSGPPFIRATPETNIGLAIEAGSKPARTLEDTPIKPPEQLPGESFSELQSPIQSLLTGNFSARDRSEETAKEAGLPTNVGVSISYTDICMELRAELIDRFEQCDKTTPKFAPRGTAETLLRGPRLLQFFQSLSLPEVAIQALDPPYEETLARRLREKRLHDFLAILICSNREIEAVQNFVIKVLARESWAAERCSLPTNRETLTELFEDTMATERFLAQQAIFCAAVISVGAEVSIQNVKEQILPYKKEEVIGKGSFGKVFMTAIAGGHIHDPHFNKSTPWTTQLARKDFTIRTDWEPWHSTEAHRIMTTILSLRKESENVLTSLGAFCIGSLTYSLFMPLAIYDLRQYMMSSHPMRPDSRKGRVAIIESARGLADGLDYLHTKLKTKEGDDLICYHVDLKPENILIFPDKTPEGERYLWQISDFAMSYVKYRQQGQEQDTVIDLRGRFARRPEPTSHDSPASKAEGQLGKGTCLAPECMETSPTISTNSDVWSLGCVISIVFTYLDDGAQGVTKYAAKRAAHSRANGCDQFFIRSKNNPRLHPAIKTWQRRLMKTARSRSKREGKEVELILRFLETDVFQEQSKRCDARSLEQNLSKVLGTYEELELPIDQGRQSGLDRLLESPMIRRIVPRRGGRALVSRLSEGLIDPRKSDTSLERIAISLSPSEWSFGGSPSLEE